LLDRAAANRFAEARRGHAARRTCDRCRIDCHDVTKISSAAARWKRRFRARTLPRIIEDFQTEQLIWTTTSRKATHRTSA
jgi:formate dehydrogenase assembly factor FdhD